MADEPTVYTELARIEPESSVAIWQADSRVGAYREPDSDSVIHWATPSEGFAFLRTRRARTALGVAPPEYSAGYSRYSGVKDVAFRPDLHVVAEIDFTTDFPPESCYINLQQGPAFGTFMTGTLPRADGHTLISLLPTNGYSLQGALAALEGGEFYARIGTGRIEAPLASGTAAYKFIQIMRVTILVLVEAETLPPLMIAPPCRLDQRTDSLALGGARLWPPSTQQQTSVRISGSY